MLRLHKLRAFLTMLGVIIGVMSVTIIVMVSSGFTFFMENQFKKLGADTIMITYNRWGRPGQKAGNISGLKVGDIEYLRNRVSQIDVIAPLVQVGGQKVANGTNTVDDPRVYGSDQNQQVLNRVGILSGRSINEEDVRQRANVCMIGTEIRDRLFPGQDPIGKYITFKGIALEVVGVFERTDLFGQSNSKDIVAPISTVQDKWIGGEDLMMILTRPKPGIKVETAMQSVWEALMLKSNNKKIYRVDSNESISNTFGKVFGAAGVVLAAIAALSLLVGGIGIMNIMLVSVTERTREIGLRKAVGAKQGTILLQFIVEAATLSLVGGMIGMGIAWMIGKLVTAATAQSNWPSAGGLPTPFPVTAAIGAAIFSACIGVVFGLYPAVSASKMDPIEALRHE